MADPTSSPGDPARELTRSLKEILASIGALLDAPDPALLLEADGPVATAVARFRRALASLRGEEAGLLARGRLAEVENERDALRSRQSELLEQVLSLTGRLEATRRDALGLRFEAERARAESRRLERELREADRERPPAVPAVPVPGPPLPARQPEPAVPDVTSLRAELEEARAKSAERGRAARAALDELFAAGAGRAAPADEQRQGEGREGGGGAPRRRAAGKPAKKARKARKATGRKATARKATGRKAAPARAAGGARKPRAKR